MNAPLEVYPRNLSAPRALCCVALILGLVSPRLWAQTEPPPDADKPPDLIQLSLADLMNIEVTSVSKRSERLSDAPASVFVITGEKIRRSGATTLPEALRLAPNLHVAQVSASAYAITARGFSNAAANKLLVLIDGRSVYTPLFSGVFWDAQDVMLEDIDRIEIISGPGGTLWGTNAVNGVINVITRSARQTHGGVAAVGAGDQERSAATRYGGALGAHGSYRVYGKYLAHDHTSTENGTAKDDAWHKVQGGFRADWERGRDELTVQGDLYRGSIGQPLPGSIVVSPNAPALDTISISGVNLLARWARQREDGSGLTVQAYYDRTERTVPPFFAEDLDLFDVQAQYALRPMGMHRATWGAEYRHGMDRLTNSTIIAFLPANVDQSWAALFAQDEMTLREDVKLTIGARAERNDYTGMEYLPSARLAWKAGADRLLWTAASRTVRAPSRLDRDTFVPGTAPFLLAGGPNVRSEIGMVYEIGYRAQASPALTYSIAGYHTVYDHLRTQEIAPSRTSLFFANGMEGTTTGVEIWGSYQPLPSWRLSGGFTAIDENLRLKPGSNDVLAPGAQEGRDPSNTWRLSSSLDLPRNSDLEVRVRHVGELALPQVPAYLAVDLRYGWSPNRDWELSLIGRNLFGDGHAEFNDPSTRTHFERSVFFRLSRTF